MVQVKYNPTIKVLNIRIKNGKSADTKIHKNCVIDYGKDGEVVNIEVLNFDLEKTLGSGKKQA